MSYYKSQLSYDFYLALGIFIILISYLFVQLLPYHIYFSQAEELQIFNTEAYRVSQLLVATPGKPANWQTLQASQIIYIGLVDENYNMSNYLSIEKVIRLNQTCQSNYSLVKNLLGSNYDFSLTIFSSDKEILYLNCVGNLREKASLTRFVIINNTEATLIVSVGD